MDQRKSLAGCPLLAVRQRETRFGGGKHLLPCLRWYDSTHIAFSKFYREFVFSRERQLVKRGGFIEDKLGQAQSRDVLSRGLDAAVPDWRLWLYQDGLGRAVSHLDGSSGASSAELDRRYPQRVAQRQRQQPGGAPPK